MLTTFEKRLLVLDVIIAVGVAVIAVLCTINVSVWFALLGILPAAIAAGDTWRYRQIKRARRYYLFADEGD